MPEKLDIDGLHLKLKTLTWSAAISCLIGVAMAAMWYQRVESAIQEKTDDRYRARDARADFALRDARIEGVERQMSGLGSDLKDIKIELREMNRLLLQQAQRRHEEKGQ